MTDLLTGLETANPQTYGNTSSPSMDLITTIASTGSGSAYASSCAAILTSYLNSLQSMSDTCSITDKTYNLGTYVESSTSGSYIATALTTLCDGIPRAIGNVTYVQLPISYTTQTNYSYDVSCVGETAAPTPCSIGPNDCYSYYSSQQTMNITASAPDAAVCTTEGFSSCAYPNTDCVIAAGSGTSASCRLYYWPVTTTNGNICLNNGSTLINPPTATTGPNTAVFDNFTLTSPTVAISFAAISRSDGCGATVSNYILPLDPSRVYTIRGARADGVGVSMNFADLQTTCIEAGCYTEVPWSAYASAPACYSAYDTNSLLCSTILPDYNPQIDLDNLSELFTLDPSWGTACFGDIIGVFDPPIALTHAQNVAVASIPASATSTYASVTTIAAPASNPYSGIITVTAKADESALPTKDSSSSPADPSASTAGSAGSDASVAPSTSVAESSSPASDASVAPSTFVAESSSSSASSADEQQSSSGSAATSARVKGSIGSSSVSSSSAQAGSTASSSTANAGSLLKWGRGSLSIIGFLLSSMFIL